jgi:mannose-6-phosphate isomerase-like protein (cupin superfamily)
MRQSPVVSINAALASLPGPWQPVDVAAVNDAIVRVARLDGAFPWHSHDEDDLFLCWDGSFRLEMQGLGAVTLHAGDLIVVPRGVEHHPVADEICHVLLLEKPHTRQYGS